ESWAARWVGAWRADAWRRGLFPEALPCRSALRGIPTPAGSPRRACSTSRRRGDTFSSSCSARRSDPLNTPQTARISRHGREGISYPFLTRGGKYLAAPERAKNPLQSPFRVGFPARTRPFPSGYPHAPCHPDRAPRSFVG